MQNGGKQTLVLASITALKKLCDRAFKRWPPCDPRPRPLRLPYRRLPRRSLPCGGLPRRRLPRLPRLAGEHAARRLEHLRLVLAPGGRLLHRLQLLAV